MKKENNKNSGFVAITSVLIIGALIIILGVSIFHASLSDQTISASYDNLQTASNLASACVRAGISRLKNDINYRGFSSLDAKEGVDECAQGRVCVDGIVCDIRIEDVGDNTKIVSSLMRAGERAHIKTASIRLGYTISDWRRDFSCTGITIDGGTLSLQVVDSFSANIIPEMTSNSVDGHITSSLHHGETAFRAFNRNTLDGYTSLAGQLPNWIQIQFPQNRTIGRYTITSLSGANFDSTHAPRSWIFQGSNDGINWSNLHSVTEAINWTVGERREFVSDIQQSFSFYRINFTETNNVNGSLAIGEIEMHESVRTHATTGECLSHGYNILGDINILRSHIFWRGIIPNETSVLIETRLRREGVEGVWTPVFNGQGIPNIRQDRWERLDVRIRLQTTNSTYSPRLNNLTIFLEEAIPPAIADISNEIMTVERTDFLHGWAWSENIGWISMNVFYAGNYGVSVDRQGNLIGSAWSRGTSLDVGGLGWLQFNAQPITGENFPRAPLHSAKFNPTTGMITGWARFCSGTVNNDCISASRGDFNGWVLLGPININNVDYGLRVDTTVSPAEITGYAFGSEPIGWISFNCRNTNVCATNNFRVFMERVRP